MKLFRRKRETAWHPLPGRLPKKNTWVLLWIEPKDGKSCWGFDRRVYTAYRIKHKKRTPSDKVYDLCPLSHDWVIPSLPAFEEGNSIIEAWAETPEAYK